MQCYSVLTSWLHGSSKQATCEIHNNIYDIYVICVMQPSPNSSISWQHLLRKDMRLGCSLQATTQCYQTYWWSTDCFAHLRSTCARCVLVLDAPVFYALLLHKSWMCRPTVYVLTDKAHDSGFEGKFKWPNSACQNFCASSGVLKLYTGCRDSACSAISYVRHTGLAGCYAMLGRHATGHHISHTASLYFVLWRRQSYKSFQ